jgi:hypothetical protein
MLEMTQLQIIPAWQIGLNNPLRTAVNGISNPLIPDNVTDPPILKVLERQEDARQAKRTTEEETMPKPDVAEDKK